MVRRWLKIGGGIAAGITTVLALFALLVSNFGFEITDLTGNFTCEGTYENPCRSRFEVRNPTFYDVDIYSKYQVKLDFSPEIEDYALFVPDGRCSATGKCRCELANGEMLGFEDWRCVDFTNKTKPRKDRVYNFRFPRYSTTEFLLAGIKKNSIDEVKWAFGVNDEELDPIWYGTPELDNETLINQTIGDIDLNGTVPDTNETVFPDLNSTVNLTNETDDSTRSDLPKTPTSKIIHEQVSGDVWIINKSGNELKLDVNYNLLNNTATEFCIVHKAKAEYLSDLSSNFRDIKSVPLNKTKGQLTLDRDIDLTNDNCFIVEYLGLEEGMQFKIGWNTIIIDSNSDGEATKFGQPKNIYKASNGDLFVVYPDSADDVWFANSSDDGLTWSTQEIVDAETVREVQLIVDSNDDIHVYYHETGTDDVHILNSTDGGISFNSVDTVCNLGANFCDRPVCVADSNDVLHCCLMDTTDDTMYYVNSSQWNTEVSVNANTADDSDECDIAVDSNDCPYIVASGTDQDDVDIWSPCLNGWGDANRVEISAGVSHQDPSIRIANDFLYVSYIEVNNVYYGNSSDGGSTWSTKLVDSSTNNHDPDIAVNLDGAIWILTDCAGSICSHNSSDNGVTFERTTRHTGTNDAYPSIADSNYPLTNNLHNTLRFVFGNFSSGSLQYDQFTISSLFISITLNSPTNNTVFTQGAFDILLNATSTTDVSKTFRIFGIINDSISDFYEHGLLYEDKNFIEGTNAIYNFTSSVVIPDANTVVLWHLDNNADFGESSSLTKDFSNSGNDGDVNGDAEVSSLGKFGRSYVFDGDTDYINIPNTVVTAYPFTMSAWVKFNGTQNGWAAGTAYTLADTVFYGLGALADGTPRMFSRNTVGQSAAGTTNITGDWHHLVGVWHSATDKRLYVDGVNEANNTESVTLNPNINTVDIGRAGDLSPAGYWDGLIDEVVIWNRSLNDSEILDLYRSKNGTYLWKANVTYSSGSNESETRTLIIGEAPPVEIVYNLNLTSPTTLEPLTTDRNVLMNANFTFQKDDVNQSGNMIVSEILYNETPGTILTKDICDGTADPCSTYANQSACGVITGCSWSNTTTLQLRSSNDETTVSQDPELFDFSPSFSSANYSILKSNFKTNGNRDAVEIEPVNKSTFNTSATFTNSPFHYLAILSGEYNVTDNEFIKCNNVTATTGARNVSFTNNFPNLNYSFVCSSFIDLGAEDTFCQGTTTLKNESERELKFSDDQNNDEAVRGGSWCAFSQGNYTVNGTQIRAGNFTMGATDVTVNFPENFADTNYIIITTQNDATPGGNDCTCEIDPVAVGSFEADCFHSGGTSCNGNTFDYVAVAETNKDLAVDFACIGTPDPCSTYISNATCSVANSCIWNETQQISFANGLYNFNVTVPNLDVGIYDLYINATLDTGTENITRNDTQVESVNISFTVPTITLDYPDAGANFTRNKFNITLNFTVTDDHDTAVFLYIIEDEQLENITTSLIYKDEGVASGTQISYNFTSIPVKTSSVGLKGLYHFDNLSSRGENDSIVTDFSPQGNDGIINGTINRTGKMGYSLQTDGDTYATTSYDPVFSGTDRFSISAWFRTEGSISDAKTIIGAAKDNTTIMLRMEIDTVCTAEGNDGKVSLVISDSDDSTAEIICSINEYDDGQWHHVVATHGDRGDDEAGLSLNMYIDGELENFISPTDKSNGIKNLSGNPFYIGRANIDGVADTDGFIGQIDEVTFWGKELTSIEIRDMARPEKGGYFWTVNATDPIGNNPISVEKRLLNIRSDVITEIIVNAVDDEVSFEIGIQNITLNYTISSENKQNIIIYSSITPGGTTDNNIQHKKDNVLNGTNNLHIFSALPTQPADDINLLYHLDNTDNENDTFIKEFSLGINNGTFFRPDLPRNVSYFVENGDGNIMSSTVNHPVGVYVPSANTTYIVWQGPQLDPQIIDYNHTTREWSDSVEIATNPLNTDNHGKPSLIVDNESYLHVVCCTHNDPFFYFKSAAPNNITDWIDMSTNLSSDGTYPQWVKLSNRTLLFYRGELPGTGHSSDWLYKTTIDNGETWTGPTRVLDSSQTNAWYANFVKGKGDTIHMGFIWHDEDTNEDAHGYQRFDMHHMFMNESGWFTMNGSEITLPLQYQVGNYEATIAYSTQPEKANNPAIGVDENNYPYMISLVGSETTYQFAFTKWNGTGWEVSNITDANHLFDRAGLVVKNSTNIDAYLTTGGTPSVGDANQHGRGGDITLWNYDGETWTKNSTLLSYDDTERMYSVGGNILNGTDGLEMALYEMPEIDFFGKFVFGANNLKVYVYGEDGFIENELLVSDSAYTAGKLGFAGNFLHKANTIDTGGDSSLDFDSALNFTTGFWINPDTAGTIISKYDSGSGYKIELTSDLKIGVSSNNTNFVNSSALTQNIWSHVAITYYEGNVSIYLNGLFDTSESSFFSSNSINNTLIGEVNASFTGKIDDIVIANSTWNETKIENTYRLDIDDYPWRIQAIDDIETDEIIQSIERVLHITAVAPTDSCSCPSPVANWELNLEDFCIISIDCDIADFNISFINTGNFTCDANMSFSQITAFPANQRFWSTPNCHINQTGV